MRKRAHARTGPIPRAKAATNARTTGTKKVQPQEAGPPAFARRRPQRSDEPPAITVHMAPREEECWRCRSGSLAKSGWAPL
eukprot:2692619-Alexandrium_andersonii.AAC.1